MRKIQPLCSIFTLLIFISACSQKNDFDLTNKSVKDLMALNIPIECDFKETKKIPGIYTHKKLFINGQNIKDEGIVIYTDGTEGVGSSIVKDNEVYTMLIDGSGNWFKIEKDPAYPEFDPLRIALEGYHSIWPWVLQCKKGSFGSEIFNVPGKILTKADSP